MPKPASTFIDHRTPAQRARYEKQQRKDTATWRGICNVMQLWRRCRRSPCKRHHACGADDPQACYQQKWQMLPEDGKIWLRAGIKARVAGLPAPAAAQAADAELAREIERRRAPERPAAEIIPAAAPAPAPPDTAPAPRVRGL